MGYLIPCVSLFCLVVILPSLPRHGAMGQSQFRPFWRKPTDKAKPTLLPPIKKDPEFYRKLQEEIPPIKETAEKLIKNILRVPIQRGSKRGIKFEDVVIVMDGSGSIGWCEFNNGRKAMKNLMTYKQPGVDAKYAVVTFAWNATRNFNFLPSAKAAANISDVKFPNGWTNTQAGLAEALDLFQTESRRLSRKVVLLLTDGRSSVNTKKTVPMAQKLKDEKIELFVIAVGGRHLQGIDEMAQVATYPPDKFLFRVEKMGKFLQVVNLAIKKVNKDTYKILNKYVSQCR